MITFLVLGICLLISLLFYMYKEANSNNVNYEVLSFTDFPKSFGELKIFFISDIHRRTISDKIINEVKGKVDIVIIGGDLLEKGVKLQQTEKNLQKLKKLGPLYFVWGNNDYEVNYHQLDALLLDYGVKILDNISVSFESLQGDHFNLIGVDDISLKRDRLELALQDIKNDGFRILVSHNPNIIDKVKEEYKVRLILSGHTHGGQIHLFGYSPYEKGGIKFKNNTTIFISNGYGTTALPLRMGAKAETHLITLKNKTI